MPFDATPTITVADVLRRAKALIDTPEKWGKGNGLCNPRDMGLDADCALTAIGRTAHGGTKLWGEATAVFERAIGGAAIWIWNDLPETTHADVMEAFSRAIELAERENAQGIDRAIALAEAGEP